MTLIQADTDTRSVIGTDNRDSKGISKLPLKQVISPLKVSCNRASLEIPLLSLDEGYTAEEKTRLGKQGQAD